MLDRWAERNRDGLILLARLALMLLFVLSGWAKLHDFQGTVGYMASLQAPLPQVAAAIAVAMEFVVAIALMLGIAVRPLALLFVAFVLGTALLGHAFWGMQGAERAANLTQFLKNVSIAGGLLLLVVTGAGRYAVCRSRR
ncbi:MULTISPECIES: DoxX family protein [unclassified Stenotrophomonas]|uniref:DoxX family protein n=1 Tax=unclassified Stenotrophomonas TaxID=196198 RepID=UPI0025E25FB6|nr:MULTISPECIES: DoxX family protein [unclassified Stenotrophomonas]